MRLCGGNGLHAETLHAGYGFNNISHGMDYAGGVDEQLEANFYYYCDKQRNPGEIDLIIKQNETLREYNKSRPNSGKYCYGKTPRQTALESLSLAKEKMLQ